MIIDLDMIATCAPDVAPETIVQMIQVESQGDPLALHINDKTQQQQRRAKNKTEAMSRVQNAINKGYSVDIGLMQINSKTLQRLGHSIDKAFEPCFNVAMGASLLKDNYKRALPRREEQTALRAALSAYNTGNFQDGINNGYVAKYYPMEMPVYKTALKNRLSKNPYNTETTTFKRSTNHEYQP